MYRLTEFSIRRPVLCATIILAITLAAAAGALRIETNAGFRAYVGADHPSVKRLDAFIERFGGGLSVVIAWSCGAAMPCSSGLDAASLQMAHQLEAKLAVVPGIIDIASPATAPLVVPVESGISVVRLIDYAGDSEALQNLGELARRDPEWTNALVSPDGLTAAIILDLASSDSELNIRVIEALDSAIAAPEAKGYRFLLVGEAVSFVLAGRALQHDSLRLVPVIVVLIGCVVLFVFSSWAIVVASLIAGGLAVVWAAGAMGWIGWPQTAVSQALPPFILAVSTCNAMHLLAQARRSSDQGEGTAKSLCLAAKDIESGCIVASGTTAVGFASFATSGAVSFIHFGLIAGIGVGSGLLLTFSILPVMLLALPGPTRPGSRVFVLDSLLRALTRQSQRRCWAVMALTAGLLIACAPGLSRLVVDVSIYELFGEETEVVKWMRTLRDKMGPVFTLEAQFDLPEAASVPHPSTLEQIRQLTGAVTSIESIEASRSVVDLIERSATSLGVPGIAGQRSVQNNAELLMMLSLADSSLVDRWLSLDRRSVRVSFSSDLRSYQRTAELLEAVHSAVGRNLPADWSYQLTGPVDVYFQMVDEVQKTQLRSFATATVVIFLIVAVFLRSLGWALAAMVPTVLPVVMTLAAMGVWGIYLDMGTAMVAAVVLGVAVDDTVHLLIQYRRKRKTGEDAEGAMAGAVLHVGRAVVTTSVALSLGFFVLTLSSWASVASFGFLSGIAILGAMVADLVVLPALVTAVSRFEGARNWSWRPWAA